VNTVSATTANFTVPASATITTGVGTLVITPVNPQDISIPSLYELMALADPLTPEEGEPTKPLAPLDREVLSKAMDWLKAYIVSYSGDGRPSGGRAPSHGDREVH
jgi:hypothetical protein